MKHIFKRLNIGETYVQETEYRFGECHCLFLLHVIIWSSWESS